MALTIEQLEQRAGLLGAAAELLAEADELRASGGLTASVEPRGSTGGTVEQMAALGRAQASPSQSVAGQRGAATVRAELGSRNIAAGSAISSSAEVAELIQEALQQPRPAGRVTVLRGRWDYPEERQLGDKDSVLNTERIEAVCSPTASRFDPNTGALVASGGICLPVNVDYAVPTWSTADRPLRDGLPAFQATRGGVRFVSPPDIGVADLQGTKTGSGQSVGIWTAATDANPGTATKPVWTVACGAEQLVYVNAIPTRVQFGNMAARFAPEQIAANTQQAIAISAREAELELLTLLANNTKQVVASEYLGATRDLLATVDLVREQYLYSHRLPHTVSLTAVFPAWVRGLIRADMAREQAHDNAGVHDVMAISDSQIDSWFYTRSINVIWTMDALKTGTYGTGGSAIPNQFFPVATPGQAPLWPGQSGSTAFQLAWFLFVEGTFQYLDGGRLDLGVVRDSLLDATNDYETFVEVFEGLALRGLEAYQVQSTILPNGGSAGGIATGFAGGYHE
jgi:hypothetical protein